MYETKIENGDEKIRVQIDFDYTPYEPMTRHFPGVQASVDIYSTTIIDTGAEISLLDDFREELEEEIVDWIEEESYGY